MTVDERLERIEKAIEAIREFMLSRAEADGEFAKAQAEAQGEIMEAMIVLANAVDELPVSGAGERDSLEAQHQHFKRVAAVGE